MRNARILTESGTANSLAVGGDGVILAVGDADVASQHSGKGTTVIDLKGKIVLPGLHDMHVHPYGAGLLLRGQCTFPQGSGLEAIQERLAECVKASDEGEWILGGQWDASALGGPPHRSALDEVAPDNPVLLIDTSGHSSWANSRALEKARIDRNTPNPEGGIIERDAEGNPTGVLREYASYAVRELVPQPSREERMEALDWALDQMLAYGITSFTSASVLEEEAETFAALADAGRLKQRVRLCLRWRPEEDSTEELLAGRNLYARDRLSPDCVKIMLDGVPTDSHTAAMLEPYADVLAGRDDEASRYGLLLISNDDLVPAVTRFDALGLTVKFHAAGDAAVRQGLDAIVVARNANGFSRQLHDVGHCTFVAASDIPRARPIGATYEVSPYLWAPSPINDSIIQAIGTKRIERVWPVRNMLDSGALVVPGSDWYVVPSVNPWIGIETLVTRRTPGGGESFGEDQAIRLDEALAMYTVNSAKHMGHENRIGRIAPGMLADLIVVNQDPHAVPATQLHETVVEMTIINGEIVYRKSGG